MPSDPVYQAEYRARPEVIERQAAYAKTAKVKEYRKEYSQRPEAKASKRRRRNTPEYREKALARNYSLTLEEYRHLIGRQKCDMCGETDPGSTFHIDHDHGCCPTPSRCCGKCVRGLLCRHCNIGLGYFHDDVKHLQDAIDYIRRTAI